MKLTPSILNQIKKNLKSARIIQYEKPDKTISEIIESKRGNSRYSWKEEIKRKTYRKCFLKGALEKTILFTTLTIPYKKSFSGSMVSWIYIAKALGPFIKELKKMGLEKYLVTLEAAYKGGCHARLISCWSEPFQTRKVKGKLYLADKGIENEIRNKWLNEWQKEYPHIPIKKQIQLQVCPDLIEAENAFNYVTKWIGKGSNIEVALYNAEQGKADEKQVAKLLTNYWGMKLNIRLYRTSNHLGDNSSLVDLRE
jgi:hypothetical protein